MLVLHIFTLIHVVVTIIALKQVLVLIPETYESDIHMARRMKGDDRIKVVNQLT